ncbi:MAG TPA: hypothetical protein ENO00_01295 [Deltaproteobacteria bacterium]|nr:hypothetical protein [Deltaproteobacteria bacterium]
MMGLLLFGIPAAVIAGIKGFKWGRWILSLGIIGFIWVLFLKSAKANEISPEEAIRRAEQANRVGGWLAGINVGLALAITLLYYIGARG